MSIVYLNGQFLPLEEAHISPLDRGFLFADGVYEVIPVYQGHPFRLPKHLKRLHRSLEGIRLKLPEAYQDDALTQLFEELIKRNGSGNLSIYLQITRGCPNTRDHGFPTEPVEPTLFMMTSTMKTPMVDQIEQAQGVAAITAEDIRWSRCDIKSTSLLANLLLRQQAIDAGAAEAILHKDGQVTEGAASNVFMVTRNNVLVTPPQEPVILSGITRDLILELADQQHMPNEERSITLSELANADEIWVTSSTKEILPIVTLNGQTVGNGKVGSFWKRMAKVYFNHKAKLCGLA